MVFIIWKNFCHLTWKNTFGKRWMNKSNFKLRICCSQPPWNSIWTLIWFWNEQKQHFSQGVDKKFLQVQNHTMIISWEVWHKIRIFQFFVKCAWWVTSKWAYNFRSLMMYIFYGAASEFSHMLYLKRWICTY